MYLSSLTFNAFFAVLNVDPLTKRNMLGELEQLVPDIVTIIINVISVKPSFGDGLTQETLSASFGNRKADLLI